MGYYGYGRSENNGIRAVSRRGTFGQGSLARRWMAPLEGPEYAVAMKKGATLARNGSVQSITVEPGRIVAQVVDYYHVYQVAIPVPPILPEQWQPFIAALVARPTLSAQCFNGQLPAEALAIAASQQLALVPEHPEQWEIQCQCYDFGAFCRHTLAAFALFAETLDTDPLLLLTLRGLERHRLFQALSGTEASPAQVATPLSTDRDAFWKGSHPDQLPLALKSLDEDLAESPSTVPLARIGPIPFWCGSHSPTILEAIAETASVQARAQIHNEPMPDQEVDLDEDLMPDEGPLADQIMDILRDELGGLSIEQFKKLFRL